jgi:hypothetical protein
MPTADEILSERLNRIENIPDRFISKAAATQSELFSELLVILEKLGLSNDNRLVLSSANLEQVDNLLNQYYQRIKQGSYGALVSGFIQQLYDQKGLNDEYFSIEFGVTGSAQSQAVFQQSRQKALRQLINDDFKTNFINVIRDQVIGSVEAKASFSQLRNDLFGLFTDTDQRLGVLHNWTSQVSRDLFSVSDRAYNNAVGDELGLQFIQYAGGLVKDSRPFCVERDNQYYHVNEVRSWAVQDWQGRYRRTTESNIVDWLGWYNCMHTAAYRSLASVPLEVIQRNIENGNYTPSKTERELLNL